MKRSNDRMHQAMILESVVAPSEAGFYTRTVYAIEGHAGMYRRVSAGTEGCLSAWIDGSVIYLVPFTALNEEILEAGWCRYGRTEQAPREEPAVKIGERSVWEWNGSAWKEIDLDSLLPPPRPDRDTDILGNGFAPGLLLPLPTGKTRESPAPGAVLPAKPATTFGQAYAERTDRMIAAGTTPVKAADPGSADVGNGEQLQMSAQEKADLFSETGAAHDASLAHEASAEAPENDAAGSGVENQPTSGGLFSDAPAGPQGRRRRGKQAVQPEDKPPNVYESGF